MGRTFKAIILFLCLLPAGSYAVIVPDLYQARVPIKNVQPESRAPAIKTALGLVLIKLTGDRLAPENPALQPLLNRAASYMLEYRLNADKLQLWVRFDEATLSKKLRSLGVAVWGKERPTTLLWLVVDGPGGGKILGQDGNPELLSAINKRSHERGIDLTYPLLDLQDDAIIKAADIRSGFMQPVLDASRRYPVDAILSGYVKSVAPDIWEGRWTGYIKGDMKTWQVEGDMPAMVLEEGIDDMADFLASKFIHKTVMEKTDVTLTVSGINTLAQYADVLKYLGSLSAVTRVQVSSVTAGAVTFIVTVHGGCVTLSQAVVLGRRLESLSGNECSRYRLLP